MRIVKTVSELREVVSSWRKAGESVGFVPTMGYLHEGHVSLVRRSVEENRRTVVSIFVNPAQFGPNMDLDRYPRDFAGDCEKVQGAGGDLVFAPEVAEIYPEGFGSWVNVDTLTELLDGGSRPGYFRGICTVVLKLFNMVAPDRSYFGQKDMQQALVLTKMVRDLNIPLSLIIMPTVRESDGLAMSSRNAYLKGSDRTVATELYQGLLKAAAAFKSGVRERAALINVVTDHIASFSEFKQDYVELVDLQRVQKLERIESAACLALAVDLKGTRLIDNIILGDHPLAV